MAHGTVTLFWFGNITPTNKISRYDRCRHCNNDGYVTDDYSHEHYPCPACKLGGTIDAGGAQYWSNHKHEIERMRWNHGMHIHQTQSCPGCFRPLANGETCVTQHGT